MKRIIIDFIPHKDQRYDTCGDWRENVFDTPDSQPKDGWKWYQKVDLYITVSETPDWRSSALVAVHELIEALLCKHAGVTGEEVDQFDMNWKTRTIEVEGRPQWIDEPGDDPIAPYHQQHVIATKIEETLCGWLEYSWDAHTMQVDQLE